jgi:hypothetical protein
MNPTDITAGPLPDLDTLETIANWRVDAALGDETRDFKRLCAVLKAVTHA